ncbi:MAG: class I SAM-dependent methyltransferase [Candidatus Daviesbacteria bacterium]|nr:class I SAM-dependent methyltransferase [Candidatus Daviesbacteria bacterium]
MRIEINDLKNELTEHLDQTLAHVTGRPAQETAEALLSWQRAREHFDDLTVALGKLKNKKLLEVGCGYGLFLVICLENGIRAKGIEPANQPYYQTTLRIGRELLKRSGFNPNLIKQADGEKLPYKDESFDIVVSFFTLEHVQNVKRVIQESTRVLKSGGYLYSVVPNYGSFWESHYGIIWIPYLSKSLGRLYLKLWGKNPKLLDELQLVNQIDLKNITRPLPLLVLDWGKEVFTEKVSKLKLPELSTVGSAKKIITILKTLKLLKPAIHVANLFNAQTPIVLLAQKK